MFICVRPSRGTGIASLAVISLPRWPTRLHIKKCCENGCWWDGPGGKRLSTDRPGGQAAPTGPVNWNHLLLRGFLVSSMVLLNIRKREGKAIVGEERKRALHTLLKK